MIYPLTSLRVFPELAKSYRSMYGGDTLTHKSNNVSWRRFYKDKCFDNKITWKNQ